MSGNVQDQILAFFHSRFPQQEIGQDEDIFALGFVNSLFAMELVMFLEKNFGIAIPNTELRIDNFRSADLMADLVDRQRDVSAVRA